MWAPLSRGRRSTRLAARSTRRRADCAQKPHGSALPTELRGRRCLRKARAPAAHEIGTGGPAPSRVLSSNRSVDEGTLNARLWEGFAEPQLLLGGHAGPGRTLDCGGLVASIVPNAPDSPTLNAAWRSILTRRPSTCRSSAPLSQGARAPLGLMAGRRGEPRRAGAEQRGLAVTAASSERVRATRGRARRRGGARKRE
jgi:hypothetical protein